MRFYSTRRWLHWTVDQLLQVYNPPNVRAARWGMLPASRRGRRMRALPAPLLAMLPASPRVVALLLVTAGGADCVGASGPGAALPPQQEHRRHHQYERGELRARGLLERGRRAGRLGAHKGGGKVPCLCWEGRGRQHIVLG